MRLGSDLSDALEVFLVEFLGLSNGDKTIGKDDTQKMSIKDDTPNVNGVP